jgi:hypothetical protein
VRYWDSSALVAVFIAEGRTAEMDRLLAVDQEVTVSFLTLIEIASAITRRPLAERTREVARFTFHEVQKAWTIIDDYEEIASLAIVIAERHRLRTGDAIQLATAIVASKDAPKLPFVTLDRDLARAARLEGFPTLP